MTAGLSIITAQRFGAKDIAGVRKSVGTSVWISLVFTVFLTIVSVIFTRPVLVMMNTPAEILDDAYSYLIVINWGVGAAVLFNLLANLLRALGDSRTPLLFLVVASILNIVLDLLFILVFKMGVAGAGLATVVSQLFSCLLCLIYIHKKVPLLQFKNADWSIDWKFIRQHMWVGFPMGFQASIIAIGAIILQITLNGLGATAVAAYTAAQKIDMLATQPMSSFGITMATFAAQNFGANRIDRIKLGLDSVFGSQDHSASSWACWLYSRVLPPSASLWAKAKRNCCRSAGCISYRTAAPICFCRCCLSTASRFRGLVRA